METPKILSTFALILVFSANSVFAEDTTIDTGKKAKDYVDAITDLQNRINFNSPSISTTVMEEAHKLKIMREGASHFVLSPVRDHKFTNDKKPGKKNSNHPTREPKLVPLQPRKRIAHNLKKAWNSTTVKLYGKLATKLHVKRKTYKHRSHSVAKKSTRFYEIIYNGRPLESLTHAQIMQIKRMHLSVAKTATARIVLDTITQAEDGGPLVIVGRGIGKSAEFKKYMHKLNFSDHPRNQFPPKFRGFVYNRQVGKYSTASGCFQITYSNWKKYAKLFDLKDFSVKNQEIVALELIRTGKTQESGSYNGRGYVEILKGNVHKAIRYGTNDWASSPYSQWRGKHPGNYDGLADSNAKRIQKQDKLSNA